MRIVLVGLFAGGLAACDTEIVEALVCQTKAHSRIIDESSFVDIVVVRNKCIGGKALWIYELAVSDEDPQMLLYGPNTFLAYYGSFNEVTVSWEDWKPGDDIRIRVEFTYETGIQANVFKSEFSFLEKPINVGYYRKGSDAPLDVM